MTSRGDRVLNLTVHGIGDPVRPLEDGEDRTWVTVEQFEQALDAAEAAVAQGHDVRITFDDGNDSDVRIGLPRLVSRGLTAQFFLLAGLLDAPGRVSRSDVGTLLEAGMTVGSHGWSHVDWRTLDKAAVLRELYQAHEVLGEVTGSPIDRVAVPFGSYDRTVLAHLRRAGVRRVYTSDGGPARRGTWLQARTSLHAAMTREWINSVVFDRATAATRARRFLARGVKRVR
ncbi:polysaccharide deacetylase family protein [Labedaea rhizosphaerae]|uniref:Polysaccharide deacetylase n=1 Tax=Labedaea rhizosphaerae TaxID=598644 RepID=A0A4V3D0E8_LABRH|nr:polysaccharide deacetylase family protein [Labedaea rhizosphaerae]TDQ05515.1 polysaccharide deacetylase [Labedaea rhizosphaerae]